MVWPPACGGQGGPANLCWRADCLRSHLWWQVVQQKTQYHFKPELLSKEPVNGVVSYHLIFSSSCHFWRKKNICWLVMGVSKVVGSVWEKKVSYCLQLVQQWPAQNWQLPDGSRNYRRHGKLWNSMQLKFLPSKWVHVYHRVWKRITMLRLLTK